MIFCGEKENGFFIKDYCSTLDYIEPCNTIDEQVRKILALGDADFTIFDISQYDMDMEKISDTIKLICKNNHSQAIIYAVPYSQFTDELNVLFKEGFKDFVTATTLDGMKLQFEHCLNGYNHSVTHTEFSALKSEETVKKIGIIGTQHRIGTTTYAIQFVKYLKENGYKACYVEANMSNYLLNIMQIYNISDFDKKYGLLQYEGVDHYAMTDILNFVLESYDYAIFDFGSVEESCYRDLFLEMKLKICVSGIDATEVSSTIKVLDNPFYKNINYIVNFSDGKEDTIKNLFINNMYYINKSYIPCKYSLVDDLLYKEILPVKNLVAEEISQKKKNSIVSKVFSRKKEHTIYKLAVEDQVNNLKECKV